MYYIDIKTLQDMGNELSTKNCNVFVKNTNHTFTQEKYYEFRYTLCLTQQLFQST